MCGPACRADARGMTFQDVDRLLQTFLGLALTLALLLTVAAGAARREA